MKINFEDIDEAMAEFKVPYRLTHTPKAEVLLVKMEEENALPYEYIHYLYRAWGPDKVVSDIMCSNKAWDSFVDFRKIRMAETAIRVGLEKHRLHYLLGKGCEIEEIITSEMETFFCLLKYILASASELEDLVEVYQPGAEYELKVMPELRKHLYEFGDRFFPKL